MDLCGGNRAIPISLIYSGIFINIKSFTDLGNLIIEINNHEGEFLE
jgi:hypothetical protein